MMGIRELGILDPFIAPSVINSKRSDKALSFTIFGNNPQVSTAAQEDVIDIGGDYTYVTTPGPLSIVSAAAGDNPAGTGLGTVYIAGLDENWDLQEATIDLNGVTPVVTTEQWIRIFYIYGFTPALSASNPNVVAAGAITASIGGTTQATILLGNTSSGNALFTVPRGYTGFVSLIYVSGAANDNFVARFQARAPGSTFIAGNDIEIASGQFVAVEYDPRTGNLSERTDIKVRAQAITQNAAVRVTFTITLIQNDYLQSLSESI